MSKFHGKSILIIGSGPIMIGQACEFDYSGTQACKALRQEGYRVILVNSNPATIMTDPEISDVTYIEPLTVDVLSRIISIERPDAILPTLGGQTALNLGMSLHHHGILEKFGVTMLGAQPSAIHKAEDRKEFKMAMERIGLESPRSQAVFSCEEALEASRNLGFPCVVRPAYTMGGVGGGIAYDETQLLQIAQEGLRQSLIKEVLVEESILGWKEFELEVMRDKADNVVIVCSIENLDPMGVHTGDSITVAPAQTLSDRDYQRMRNAAIAIMREIGVETGGSNVQFAINPVNGRMLIIEMNPRVSRSSALASKATGFPIAKFAAKLAIGYRLDEIMNDITQNTPACFEPTIDYVVTKIPRFHFEKFSPCPTYLGTSMRSVGEIMSIGRTFKESLQKGLRSLEEKRFGLGFDGHDHLSATPPQDIRSTPHANRLFTIKEAFQAGETVTEIHQWSKIDPWFLHQIESIVKAPSTLQDSYESILHAKKLGFSDKQLTHILDYPNELSFRARRKGLSILPVYKSVDTCAGEFEAHTPYFYSTYEQEDEVPVSKRKKVMILGGGPNRIGQGIEFDYCCVHASLAARKEGFETIMVNSNPETVSTDYDISDRLYFEPLTLEDVLNVIDKERPEGVMVQFGGQTPLNLAVALEKAGVTILGTTPDSIDRAENRERFKELLQKLNLKQPRNVSVNSLDLAPEAAKSIGYPVMVRPSYILGGASMKICHDESELREYLKCTKSLLHSLPLLIETYLVDAIEIDVDALCDGAQCFTAGVMEHVEAAGVHSGDSCCFLPPVSLSESMLSQIHNATQSIALELKVLGLLNIQFAVCQNELFVLEVNPRASRTVPFVSKATSQPLARLATQIILGKSIQSLNLQKNPLSFWFVKEAVLPFDRFPGVDPILGPEMKSTGEVMGIGHTPAMAYYKAQIAAGQKIPKRKGDRVGFILRQESDDLLRQPIKELDALGFQVIAVSCEQDLKDLTCLISIASHSSKTEESRWRRMALSRGISLITTLNGLNWMIEAAKIQEPYSENMMPLQKITKPVFKEANLTLQKMHREIEENFF